MTCICDSWPFAVSWPVLGMMHLTGRSRQERLAIASREVDDLVAGGVDGVIVEDYFGDVGDVEAVLSWLQATHPEVIVGVNVLRDYRCSFELAARYGARFVQVDSAAGHLMPGDDAAYGEELAELRAAVPVCLLGGVRFKYQPVASGRPLDEDLRIGMARCDAIVVTGDATGQETGLDKIRQFRQIVGPDYPLFVGAGLTPENSRTRFELTDGAIVGSAFKNTRRDEGIVDRANVRALMEIVRSLRQKPEKLPCQ